MTVVDVLAERLRERGLRVTPQRQQVLDAVDELGHATADQVCAHVQRHSPGLNLSTVYRTLELLGEIGLVSHAHLDHAAPTYHSRTANDHLHLVCRACGRVQEADVAHARAFSSALERQTGFVTDVPHLAVHGLCCECNAASGKQEATP